MENIATNMLMTRPLLLASVRVIPSVEVDGCLGVWGSVQDLSSYLERELWKGSLPPLPVNTKLKCVRGMHQVGFCWIQSDQSVSLDCPPAGFAAGVQLQSPLKLKR